MGLLYKIMNVKKSEIETIEDWLFDCSLDDSENNLVDFIREQIIIEDCCVWELDLRLLVMEFIMNDADVSELIDYLNFDEENDEISLTATKEERNEIMSNILVEDRNDSWLFLVEYFGIDINIEEQKN